MRAEAYFRNGNITGALADINLLRTSRTREALFNNNVPGKPLASLDATKLYNEIGYEMYWEMYRRKAMIRFGKFDLAGTAKPASQPYRRIFLFLRLQLMLQRIFTKRRILRFSNINFLTSPKIEPFYN